MRNPAVGGVLIRRSDSSGCDSIFVCEHDVVGAEAGTRRSGCRDSDAAASRSSYDTSGACRTIRSKVSQGSTLKTRTAAE
jgi:hypothetical protein